MRCHSKMTLEFKITKNNECFLFSTSAVELGIITLFNFCQLIKIPLILKFDARVVTILHTSFNLVYICLVYLCFVFESVFPVDLTVLLICLVNQLLLTLSTFFLVFYFINFNLFLLIFFFSSHAKRNTII